jgi:predicted nuclease with TOPRIM domain
MDPADIVTNSPPVATDNKVEVMLQDLWEKVRSAAELIVELRSQRSILEVQAEELQKEVVRLKKQCSEHEDVVKSLSEQLIAAGSVEGKMLSNGERERIAARVKDLLARIDGYL